MTPEKAFRTMFWKASGDSAGNVDVSNQNVGRNTEPRKDFAELLCVI